MRRPAARRVSRSPPLVSNAPMAPAVVCYAFALELYLKLLHVLTTGKSPKGHKLDELFLGLPPSAKAEITALYGNNALAALSAAGDAFVEWRYGHEHEGLTINPSVLSGLATCCHQVARRIMPTLAVF